MERTEVLKKGIEPNKHINPKRQEKKAEDEKIINEVKLLWSI